MNIIASLFIVLFAVSVVIVPRIIIKMRKRRREAEEVEQRRKAEEEAQRKAKEKEQRRLADELQKAEEKRKRIEEEKRRRAQEEEQRRKREKEAREKTEGMRSGGRSPLERGGRSRGSIKQHEMEQTPGTKPRSLKPEIVCWNEGWRWIVGIEVPEELETLSVAQNEELLEQDNTDESRYRLKHAEGAVKITWTGGEKDILLVGAGRNYFIFKMRKDWKGLGRLVKRPTTGYYVAIIPQEWKRDEEVSGPVPIAPENVQIEGYTAHFFYQEQNTVIGFITTNGERIRVESGGSRFQLVGKEIGDASEYMGPLFAEQLPRIQTLNEKGWSDVGVIVVGEEGIGRNRWRTQFIPQVGDKEQKLPQEIANRRGRWYFVRIYDNDDNLLESMDFRFLTALNDIRMENFDFLPGPNGYDSVTVRFLHRTDCKVELMDENIQHALKIRRESSQTIVTVPPKPDCDKTHWILRDGEAEIEVTVLIERIWWAFGVMEVTPTDWVDKPIVLSRKDFTAITDKALWVRFPRLHFVRKISVGFDRTKSRSYQVKVEKKELVVPLRDFCDAKEIENPKQKWFLQLFIDSKDKTYSTSLLQIHISFHCKNCEFITSSEREALSHVTLHLSGLIPHLSYEELYQRFSSSLPPKIYKCSYCNFYAPADDPLENATSTIEKHEENCQKAVREGERTVIKFSVVSDVDEIRENVIVNLPHIYQCRICGKEFKGDDRELKLNHLQENHKDELFEIF